MKYSRAKVSNYQRKVQQANFQNNYGTANFMDWSALNPQQLQEMIQLYGPQIIPQLQAMGGQVADVASQVGGSLGNLASNVGDQLGNLQSHLPSMSNVTLPNVTLPDVSGIGNQVREGFNSLSSNIPDISGIREGGQQLLNQGTSAIQQAGDAISGMSPAAKNAALGGSMVGTGMLGILASRLRGGKQPAPAPAPMANVGSVAQAAPMGLGQRAMAMAQNPMARKLGIGAGIAAGTAAAGLGGKALYDMNQGNYSHKTRNIASFCSNPSNF